MKVTSRRAGGGARWRAYFWIGALLSAAGVRALAASSDPLIDARYRLTPDAPEWRALAESFGRRPDTVTDFEERRFFSVRKEPIVLKGEVRVSPRRGLSLHYISPEERMMIIDEGGLVLRDSNGRDSPPADPRTNVVNEALRHILRLDFAALAPNFELYGRQAEGATWFLALVPRAKAVRGAIGDILVQGENDVVRRIELRRSARQHVDIVMAAPHPAAEFTAEELKRYFR